MADPLDTVADFVNTVHYEQGSVEEQLDSPEALGRFLRAHRLLDARATPTPADLRRARELREAIRALLVANNGGALDPHALEQLNLAAARSRVVAAFDDHLTWRLEPASRGMNRAMGGLLALVFQSMSDGSWERLKACADPDCRWAFHDRTKNHSGRWCDMATCGNRMKARRFRERAKAKQAH